MSSFNCPHLPIYHRLSDPKSLFMYGRLRQAHPLFCTEQITQREELRLVQAANGFHFRDYKDLACHCSGQNRASKAKSRVLVVIT